MRFAPTVLLLESPILTAGGSLRAKSIATRVSFCVIWLAAGCVSLAAQQTGSPAWEVTLKPNTSAASTLTVVNRCKQAHQFQIQQQETPFLQISQAQLTVKGGESANIPVSFSSTNLTPGTYRGSVAIVCQSCSSEPTCTQDREVLQVVLQVAADITPGTAAPTGSPRPSPTPQPGTITRTETETTQPVGAAVTAAELKKRCEDLQRALNQARGPCERKSAECVEQQGKLNEAAAAAKKAQEELDQKKKAFDEGMQNLLNGLTAAAKAKGYEVGLSLTKRGDKWAPLEFAPGVVIWFDTGGIEGQQYIDNLRSALRGLVRGELNLARLANQLKALAAAAAEAERKNQEAQAALAAAQQSYERCLKERDELCRKVTELQGQLDQCRRDLGAATTDEARRKREEEAARKAEQERLANEQKLKDEEQKRKTAADQQKAEEAAATAARELERLKQRRLCTRCLKYLLQQQASGAAPDQNQRALQALSNALDQLNDSVDKATKASDILPGTLKEQLENLAGALSKISELRDLADQISGIVEKLNRLTSGGNDPAQFATALQLTADVLSAVAQRVPLLGPIAAYFKVLADAADAIVNGLPNALGAAAANKWKSMIEARRCREYVSKLATYDGDIDRVYNWIFGKEEQGVIDTVPRAREKLKEAIQAKLTKCCLEMVSTNCEDR